MREVNRSANTQYGDLMREDEEKSVKEDLKPKLNSFLWEVLPPEMTLREAETLSCNWFEEIVGLWNTKRP